MSDITLGNRSGSRGFSCRKLLIDSCPYPRTNFLGVSLAPPEENIKKIKNIRHLFQSKYILSGITKVYSNYFSIQPIIRGDVSDLHSEITVSSKITKLSNKFKYKMSVSLS